MTENREPDERLIKEWQADLRRDEISEILVERHAPRVARFFQRRGFTDDASRDLTQDVFLRVFRSLPQFRRHKHFEIWLFEIVRNVWKNAVRHRRTQKRDTSKEVPLDDVAADGNGDASAVNPNLVEDSVGEGPLNRVLVEERLRHLRDAVAQLPPDLQRLLICQLDQGLKMNEISALLKIPEGTVKSRLATARGLLRNKLKHLDPGTAPSRGRPRGEETVPPGDPARRRRT